MLYPCLRPTPTQQRATRITATHHVQQSVGNRCGKKMTVFLITEICQSFTIYAIIQLEPVCFQHLHLGSTVQTSQQFVNK